LKSVFYEGNNVKLCFQCKGIFLAKDSLKNIEESREIDIPPDTPVPKKVNEIERSCPACRIPMKKVKRGKILITIIDVCESCSGVWLDRGELESIQADYETCEDNRLANIRQEEEKKKEQLFHCPKCNHPQAPGTECVKCGIIFAKYQQVEQHINQEISRQKYAAERLDEIFKDLKGYEFKREISYLESLTGFETRNEYGIRLIGTNYHWVAREIRGSILSGIWRTIFPFLYPYTLEVYDHNRNLVFTLKERKRFYFYRTDVHDAHGKFLGYIQRGLSILRRKVTVHNVKGLEIYRLSTTFTNPHSFKITRRKVKVGEIKKKWGGVFKEYISDADNYSSRFNQSIDKTTKALFLASTYTVDKSFFEGGEKEWGQIFGIPFLDSIFGKLIIAGLFLCVIFYFGYDTEIGLTSAPIPEQISVARKSSGIKKYEFKDLLDKNKPFSTLASKKYYTVVEVYLDSCSICRELESGFNTFLANRKDVLIRRVHMPENMTMSFSSNNEQELERMIKEMNERHKSYNICGTPHIEVYAPKGQLIVADNCTKKDGTKYLRRWMREEKEATLEKTLM
jgi:Zn-finger nucleic acid-binding protein